LLAPPDTNLPPALENVEVDASYHRQLLSEMQRLRGSIYLKDGAVQPNQLSIDGLHQTPEDERSWHLLMVDKAGRVDACAWYMEHPSTVPVERLRVRNCALAHETTTRPMLWAAVEQELERARDEGLGYAEVGGWAVAEHCRSTSEGLVLALAGYSLGQLLGGALGVTTATVRHCSSTILRRLGALNLKVGGHSIPSYYDPRYNCEMELLRFDSRRPNPKYAALVQSLSERLAEVSVIASSSAQFLRSGLRVSTSLTSVPHALTA